MAAKTSITSTTKHYATLLEEFNQGLPVQTASIYTMLKTPITSATQCIHLERTLSTLDHAVISFVNDPRKNHAFHEQPTLKDKLTHIQNEVDWLHRDVNIWRNRIPSSLYLMHMCASIQDSLSHLASCGIATPLTSPIPPRATTLLEIERITTKITTLRDQHRKKCAMLAEEQQLIASLQQNLAKKRETLLHQMIQEEERICFLIESSQAERLKKTAEAHEIRRVSQSKMGELTNQAHIQSQKIFALKKHATTLHEEYVALKKSTSSVLDQQQLKREVLAQIFQQNKAELQGRKHALISQENMLKQDLHHSRQAQQDFESHGTALRDTLENAKQSRELSSVEITQYTHLNTMSAAFEKAVNHYVEEMRVNSEMQAKLTTELEAQLQDFHTAQNAIQKEIAEIQAQLLLKEQEQNQAIRLLVEAQTIFKATERELKATETMLSITNKVLDEINTEFGSKKIALQNQLRQTKDENITKLAIYDAKAKELTDTENERENELAQEMTAYTQKLHQLEEERAKAQAYLNNYETSVSL